MVVDVVVLQHTVSIIIEVNTDLRTQRGSRRDLPDAMPKFPRHNANTNMEYLAPDFSEAPVAPVWNHVQYGMGKWLNQQINTSRTHRGTLQSVS